MKDALRTKLNLIMTAVVAFAIGLGAAVRFDLIPASLARVHNPEIVWAAPPPAPAAATPSGGDLANGFADIAERLSPAVVTVDVERELTASTTPRGLPSPFEDLFRDRGRPRVAPASGSGFVISEDGYILTNNHVVADAVRIRVRFANGRFYDDVRLVGRDETTDVALLKLEGGPYPAAPLGSSDSTRVGEWVLAIGSPGFGGTGQLFTTITAGIVSAKGRSIGILSQPWDRRREASPAIEDFIQTDAVINPGNSGGPLVNARGEVVGINSAIASTTGTYQGYGFAVPIDLARDVVDDLVKYGKVRRAILGVSVQGVTDEDAQYLGLPRIAGAQVMGFPNEENGPAAKAGLEIGDVITAINGEPVATVSDLQRKVREHEPGETVRVDIVRWKDGSKGRVKVKLASADEGSTGEARPALATDFEDPLGLKIEAVDAGLRDQLELPDDLDGVVVEGVQPLGAGDRAGLQRGFVILSVNRRPIHSRKDYRAAVRGLAAGEVVGMLVYNPATGARIPVTLRIPKS